MTNQRSDLVSALRDALPHLDWSVTPAELKRKSLDFHWFSPILRRQLEGKLADAIVRPRHVDELREIVSGCVRQHVPLTIRGAGTGNYGQAVPLEGGIVVEMTACDQLIWVKDGVARAQAGIKLGVLDRLLAPSRWEIRCMPSTYRMATLGGLFCGGFGGIGSITYGPLSAPGTVLGVTLMTVESRPRIIELRAPEAMQHAHQYGTNGIILELEIALVPAYEWDEYLLVFPAAGPAFGCAHALARGPGIIKKEVALFADSVARYFKRLSPLISGQHAVIAVVSASHREVLETLVKTHSGRVALRQTGSDARTADHTLLEYCWNHTTLHALRSDRSLTYLQTDYEHGREWEQLSLIEKKVGDEVLTHLEFIRDEGGRLVCTGLPLVRFSSENRLLELIEVHRDCGIRVNNPHVYTLEDGRHRGVPGVTTRIDLKAKQQFDPCGLLNPGKLRSVSRIDLD